MTIVEQMARFVNRAAYEELPAGAREQLKLRVLDTIGCAVGALGGEPIRHVRAQVRELGGTPQCTLIGGGKTSIDRAAFHNSALVRYLDFMDNFLADGETCHPSDNFGAVLAAAELADGSGRELMTALAVAYQVQCRMSEAAPIMRSGFDHTTQQAFSVAAGVAKALRMGVEQTADALAIGGVDSVSLAVNRAEPMSQWKGLASADQAFRSVHNTLLARRGITGPRVVFEGPKGFMEALEEDFEIRWETEPLDVLPRTLVKRFNAEVHSQSALEAVVDLRSAHSIDPAAVDEIDVRVFQTAYDIIGGGEFGAKGHARYKESADHDLTYLAAVALIDGEVYPEQHAPQRINRGDVQSLMKRVRVTPKRGYTRQYPDKMMCDVTIHLEGGQSHTMAKSDYEGFPTRPMSWQTVEAKFHRLARPFMDEPIRKRLAAAVRELESIRVGDLCALLSRADGADAAAGGAGRGDQ